MACPVEVRSLFAAAHNAWGALDRARHGTEDWDRAWRKLNDLGKQVQAFQPIMDAHFGDKP